MMIVDTAGMGKTTMLKFMFLRSIDQEAGIPIFIELRKISRKKPLISFILEQLSSLDGKNEKDLIYKMFESGKFTLLLDGFDEIKESERTAVIDDIVRLVTVAPKNSYILSSRDETALSAFPSFMRYNVRPLQRPEAFDLLRRYAEGSPIAEDLISRINLPENHRINEFLTNPLLTSLLYKSYSYRQVIPLQRHIFYRQVFEALFLDHDLSKEGGGFVRDKQCGLTIDEFDAALRAFGALTYQTEKVEFTVEEATELCRRSLERAYLRKVQPSTFLHDLTHAVPLLVEEANILRWGHRSIQEYYAAQDICRRDPRSSPETLLRLFLDRNQSHHDNLLLLCAGIDREAFDRGISKHIAESLLAEFNSGWLKESLGISGAEIAKRKRVTVGRRFFVVNFEISIPTPESGNRIDEDVTKALTLYTNSVGGNSSSFRGGFPGIGEVSLRIPSFIQNSNSELHLPYIKMLPLVTDIPQGFYSASEKIQPVTDDPDAAFNDPKIFSTTTDLIRTSAGFEFDPEAAQAFLAELRQRESSSMMGAMW